MAIVNDQETKRVVDTETGEYLVCYPSHWQDPYLHFVIRSSDEKPLFGADVERDAIDEAGEGGATLVRYIVRRAWFPSGRLEKPTYFYGETEFIGKLEQFVKFWAKGTKPKNPQPRCEFMDGRNAEGGPQ